MNRRLATCLLSLVVSCSDSAVSGDDRGGGGGGASGMNPSAAACSTETCHGEGQACVQDRCVSDCRVASATACSDGRVCDFSDGRCAVKGSPGILSGDFTDCAGPKGTQHCGPGSTCSLDGVCAADGPCAEVTCDEAGRCYGTSCPKTRPAPLCTLPDTDKLRDVSASAISFDFDRLCNSYVVTLTGYDYLYQVAPDGSVTTVAGYSDANMHEVVAAPLASSAKAPGDVALIYGIHGSAISLLQRGETLSLPPLVPTSALPTGVAPIGAPFDSYAAGLTYGPQGRLFVANAQTTGDLVEVLAKDGTTTTLYTDPNAERITAATQYNIRSLVIGMTSGELRLFDLGTKKASVLSKGTGEPIASLAMDRFTGTLYVGHMSGNVVTVDAKGTVTPFAKHDLAARLRIAPDNALYCLTASVSGGGVSGPSFTKTALPSTR